ncbi:hypothetical protein KR222_004968, partial [Zaprionus bogoriensis]
ITDMEETIVSIYDLLLKRQRQIRKEQTVLHVDNPLIRRAHSTVGGEPGKATADESKKPKANRTRIGTEVKPRAPKATPNEITASHLTKKFAGNLLPAFTRKDVLNRLVEKMSGSKKTAKASSADSSDMAPPSPELQLQVPVISVKKAKASPRAKSKNTPKVSSGSGSSNLRRRLALSPRNTNSTGTSTISGEKPK